MEKFLFLLTFMALLAATYALECYVCSGSSSNDECNENTEYCGGYYTGCEVTVGRRWGPGGGGHWFDEAVTRTPRSRGHGPGREKAKGKGKGGDGYGYTVSKRCVRSCASPGQKRCSRGRCTYCCTSDLCNRGVVYVRPGPPGPPGPAGPRGPQGPQGHVGPTGPAGTPGRNGTKGSPGRTGHPGPIGPQGKPGPVGQKGYRGVKGAPGPKGDVGRPGVEGQPGPEGPRGWKGDVGNPGQHGVDGMKGDGGSSGLPGRKGKKGDAGECMCDDNYRREVIAFHGNASGVRTHSGALRELVLDNIITNIGGCLSTEFAQFTASYNGTYFFQATSSANGNSATPLLLFHNEAIVMTTGRTESRAVGPYSLGTNQCVLYLLEGDRVTLRVKPRNGGFISGILNRISSRSDITFVGYKIAA